jgi:tetratricopeptide (TPR) repeat protein
MPANGGEAASLVESARLLRWRAPELALLLADRAVTAAQDDKMAVLQADHLAAFSLNRLGRHGEAAHRLFPAIRDADTPQCLRHELHVELAHCAVALGEPATAFGAVSAVLAAGDDVAPVLRGGALVAVAEASAALGRDDLATSALQEADELYREDPSLDHDTALLLRASARAVDAARHRRRGAVADAEVKAREGRELLAGLADPEHDNGEVSARLMLEIVFALLDRDAGDAATQEVRPLLRRPVRAAAAGTVGRLRLALATRVHLAEGRHEPALTLLADAVEGAQRHGVDAVLAECLEGLSHVHEARGEFADALHCVRAARAAEGRHRRHMESARSTLLENCRSARREEVRLVGQVAVLLGNAGGTGPDSDAGSLSAEIAVGVAARRTAESDTPESEVLQSEMAEAEAAHSESVELELAESKVAEPETAELEVAGVAVAEVEVAELEVGAADIGEVEVAEVESPQSFAPALMPAAQGISLVESSVPSSEPVPADLQAAEAELSSGLDSWQSKARHRRGTGTLVCVSDLLPASALSSGRSGRRRAEEPAEDHADETSVAEAHQIGDDGTEDGSAGRRQAADCADVPSATYPLLVQLPRDPSAALEGEATDSFPAEDIENVPSIRREFPSSGPPPAPTPRALEWESVDDSSAGEGEAKMGLGDLLAEALAAYQESRDVHADTRSTGMRSNDGSTAADAEASRDVPRYRGPGTRWTTGLALAPNPIDRHDDDPSEAVTNPLLRLPDLTAEPRWVPPETGRRSAAGD